MYVKTFEGAQSLRKETMNRIRCALRDTLPAELWEKTDFSDKALAKSATLPNDQRELAEIIEQLEAAAKRGMRREMRKHSLWPWVQAVVGLDAPLAALLLSRIGDPARFANPAKLWAYCGLGGPNWKERPASRRLRSLCWNLGECFVKCGDREDNVYGALYRERKAHEAALNESGAYAEQAAAALRAKDYGKTTAAYGAYASGKLPPAHIHSRAKRYAVKRFLRDLWRAAKEG